MKSLDHPNRPEGTLAYSEVKLIPDDQFRVMPDWKAHVYRYYAISILRWFRYLLNCSDRPRVDTSSSHQRSAEEEQFTLFRSDSYVQRVAFSHGSFLEQLFPDRLHHEVGN